MSGEFDSRKDSHSTKFEQRPQIILKLSLESCLIQSYLVYIVLIIWLKFIELKIGQKEKRRLGVYETSIFEVIFVTLSENASVINDTHGPQKYPNHCN